MRTGTQVWRVSIGEGSPEGGFRQQRVKMFTGGGRGGGPAWGVGA